MNETLVRLAVIGAGHWAPNLIRNFHDHQGSEVAWVVDLDVRRREQVQFKFPDVRVGSDALEAIADDGVDAVAIATPTSTHYSLTKAAIEHGKHVFVEKPITCDAVQGEELCRLAKEASLVLMVGHVFIFNPGVQRVRQYLESGNLGRVYYISMVRTGLGPIRLDVNAAWDLASHDLSIANYWLGGGPESVSAVGGTWINSGIEDAVFATLHYPGNVLVTLHTSWLSPRKTRDITVVGEHRMITLDDMNMSEPMRIYDKRVTDERTHPAFIDTFASFRASVREGDITIPRVQLGEPLKAECEHFIECVRHEKTPLTGGAEGVLVVRALEALERSLRNGGSEERVDT